MKIYVYLTDDKNQTYEGLVELQKTKKQKGQRKINISIKGPTDLIKSLYLEKFFEKPRVYRDIEDEIKSKKYNFDTNAIVNALTRAKFLKRKGKSNRYSYIQKIPPN